MAVKKLKLSPRAKRNIEWIEQHLVVPEGRLVGQPVKLSIAQREWMEQIYGMPTRTFICSLPRKNGKTAWSGMLLLLHLVGPEATHNGQLYSAAQSREQASILFQLAAKMIRMSADLSQYVIVKDSAKELACAELGTKYRALSADASTAYGLSPVFVVHDELGQVRGPRSELYEALETASAAQQAPLSIVISTQSPKDSDLLSLLIDSAKRSNDPRTKCVLYAVPSDADPFDRDTLAKAQPNWHLMNHEEVFRMSEEAKRMPSRESSFRNLIANQRVNMTDPFVTRSVWEANAGAADFSAVQDCYIGVDLSARNDLTAVVVVGRDADGIFHVLPYFFAPQIGIEDRSQRDRETYDVWAREGFITTTPGASVDYAYVAQQLVELCDTHDVKAIPFDRWRIDVLKSELARMNVELPLVPFGQGFKDMTPALDQLESLLLDGKIRHGGNPVLDMCAENAVATRDPAGGRKLDKSKATGRIDGMQALAMAIGAANTQIPVKPPEYQMMFI